MEKKKHRKRKKIPHNTQHTIISSNVFDKLEDSVSVADWIYAAVNGDVQSHGLALLEK